MRRLVLAVLLLASHGTIWPAFAQVEQEKQDAIETAGRMLADTIRLQRREGSIPGSYIVAFWEQTKLRILRQSVRYEVRTEETTYFYDDSGNPFLARHRGIDEDGNSDEAWYETLSFNNPDEAAASSLANARALAASLYRMKGGGDSTIIMDVGDDEAVATAASTARPSTKPASGTQATVVAHGEPANVAPRPPLPWQAILFGAFLLAGGVLVGLLIPRFRNAPRSNASGDCAPQSDGLQKRVPSAKVKWAATGAAAILSLAGIGFFNAERPRHVPNASPAADIERGAVGMEGRFVAEGGWYLVVRGGTIDLSSPEGTLMCEAVLQGAPAQGSFTTVVMFACPNLPPMSGAQQVSYDADHDVWYTSAGGGQEPDMYRRDPGRP